MQYVYIANICCTTTRVTGISFATSPLKSFVSENTSRWPRRYNLFPLSAVFFLSLSLHIFSPPNSSITSAVTKQRSSDLLILPSDCTSRAEAVLLSRTRIHTTVTADVDLMFNLQTAEFANGNQLKLLSVSYLLKHRLTRSKNKEKE